MTTSLLALASQPRGRYDHMDGWSGWMWFGGLLWLLIIVSVVAVVAWLVVRTAGPASGTKDSSDSARRILAERFARGEIDEDEYIRRRELLG